VIVAGDKDVREGDGRVAAHGPHLPRATGHSAHKMQSAKALRGLRALSRFP
jgi:hypothetical protein